ncbi:MAG: hypothetical protein ACPGO5_02925 [Patescibacteria group bacterium]
MSQKMIINGMYCAACEALITMELEEVGLADKVLSLTLKDNNAGELELSDVTEEEAERITKAINDMDSYSVE